MQAQPMDIIGRKHSELVILPLESIAPRVIALQPRQLLPSQAPTLPPFMNILIMAADPCLLARPVTMTSLN